MTSATLFPFAESDAVELGEGLWAKKLLPFGKIKLPDGRELNVDADYCRPIMSAFSAGAHDQVALQMADTKNTHTDDPERFRGEVTGLELKDDGLYGTIKTTGKGTETVKDNPKLGVSVRVLDGFEDHEGRRFKRTLHHVLATLSPRVQRMGSWQLIKEFADDGYDTIDLTEESPLPVIGDATTEGGDMPDITAEELAAAEDAWASAELGRLFGSLEPTSLSQPVTGDLELAEAMRQTRLELAEVKRDRNKERANNEIDKWALAGVPPALLQLARPLLENPEQGIVELADGNRINSASIVRRMLDECKGYVELGLRVGHAETMTEQQMEDDILNRWEKEGDI